MLFEDWWDTQILNPEETLMVLRQIMMSLQGVRNVGDLNLGLATFEVMAFSVYWYPGSTAFNTRIVLHQWNKARLEANFADQH